MRISFGLLALKIYHLLPTLFHQSLRNNVVGLQQSEYERVIGNGERISVLSVEDLVIIFGSVDLP
jgi:hypothetical protein